MKAKLLSKVQQFLLHKRTQETLKACFRFVREEAGLEGQAPSWKDSRLALTNLEKVCLAKGVTAFLSTPLSPYLEAQEPSARERAYYQVLSAARAAALQLFGRLPAPLLGLSLEEGEWARKLTSLAPAQRLALGPTTTAEALDVAVLQLQQVRQQIAVLYAIRHKLADEGLMTSAMESECETALSYLWDKHKRAQSEQVMLSTLLSDEFEDMAEDDKSWAVTELLDASDQPSRNSRKQTSAKPQSIEDKVAALKNFELF